MTVPTFYNLDNGLGDTSESIAKAPFVVLQPTYSPRYILDTASGGGGGETPPTSGQLWPRRA